jgi:hypothetical protein
VGLVRGYCRPSWLAVGDEELTKAMPMMTNLEECQWWNRNVFFFVKEATSTGDKIRPSSALRNRWEHWQGGSRIGQVIA